MPKSVFLENEAKVHFFRNFEILMRYLVPLSEANTFPYKVYLLWPEKTFQNPRHSKCVKFTVLASEAKISLVLYIAVSVFK